MNKLDACKGNYRQLVICYKKHKYLTTNILIGFSRYCYQPKALSIREIIPCCGSVMETEFKL